MKLKLASKVLLPECGLKRGSRPRLIKQQKFEYAYIFGATCPSSGKTLGAIMPLANTEAMNMHLRLISQSIAKGKHAVIVLDQATWHRSSKLAKFNNLTLLPLPPYSPELNPQEQVWQWLRDKHLANRAFADYEDIVTASCTAFNDFSADIGRVKKLCTRQWAII
ncbi:MAG: IS630 family transposase [Burkholderiales bacterium]